MWILRHCGGCCFCFVHCSHRMSCSSCITTPSSLFGTLPWTGYALSSLVRIHTRTLSHSLLFPLCLAANEEPPTRQCDLLFSASGGGATDVASPPPTPLQVSCVLLFYRVYITNETISGTRLQPCAGTRTRGACSWLGLRERMELNGLFVPWLRVP